MKRLLLLSAAILLAIVGKAQGDESADLRYRYFFLEAVCQQQKGNYAAAFDLLRYARELRPDAAEVYFQLSGYYTDLKNDSLARMCFMKAAQLAPGNDTYQEGSTTSPKGSMTRPSTPTNSSTATTATAQMCCNCSTVSTERRTTMPR